MLAAVVIQAQPLTTFLISSTITEQLGTCRRSLNASVSPHDLPMEEQA